MKTLTLIILLIFCIQTAGRGQSVSLKDGQTILRYSSETTMILNELDSLLKLNSIIEFRTVGESNRISNKFLLYGKLVKTASEKELLVILANPKESASVKGYAYMAYAFRCDTEKRKEKTLNYSFKLNTLNGCIGYDDMTFSDFKKYIRKRNGYDPNPKRTVIDNEEKQAIKEENKIRQEQGFQKRKE